jgi:hypothetical protein
MLDRLYAALCDPKGRSGSTQLSSNGHALKVDRLYAALRHSSGLSRSTHFHLQGRQALRGSGL